MGDKATERFERDGLTPVDVYPPYTAAERIEVEWMTDPRRDWPSRQECEADRMCICVHPWLESEFHRAFEQADAENWTAAEAQRQERLRERGEG